MRTIGLFDTRNRWKQVIDQTVEDADVTAVARRDAPDVVAISLATFDSRRATAPLLQTPANAAQLAQSIRPLRAGKAGPHDLVEP